MKKIIFTFLLLVAFFTGYTQMYNNGGSVTVETGATLVIEGNYTSTGAAAIQINGNVQLKGDFINNGGTVVPGSTGTLEFDGTNAQQITGTQGTTFNCNVKINNAAGVSLLNYDQAIEGGLTFSNGLLTLGSQNLTLGTASTLTRTLGHVNATGTGEFRKKFASAGSFNMPVGDATRYTPVTVSFNSGTFGGAAYVGTKVVASAHPNLPTTTDYIARYWKMSSNDITNINCNLTFNFDASDIVGTVGNLYNVKYLGSGSWKPYNAYIGSNQLTASNVDGFSDWTGSGKIAVAVDLTAYLQGPYNTTTHQMNTTINGFLPLSQPFGSNSAAMWYYTGTESVGAIPNADIVDWVQVELRHATTPANATSGTIIGRAAGFLTKTGAIVALDGTSKLKVDAVNPFNDNLYLVVFQRNHLGIMSNNAVVDGNSDGAMDYNYSTNSTQVYGGTAGYKLLETGVWGMVAADGTGDGNVYLTDYTTNWTPQYGSENGYYSADYNLDGSVYLTDFTTVWTPNYGIEGPIPLTILPDLSNIKLKYSSQVPSK
jgi:hypothetical protein